MKKLRMKLIVYIAAVLLVAFALLVVLITVNASRALEAEVRNNLEVTAQRYATQIKSSLDTAASSLGTITNDIVALKHAGQTDRAAHERMLYETLKANDRYANIWAEWEIGAFDAKDAQFITSDNTTGRFLPWFVRDENGEIEEYSAYDEGPTEDEYYARPRDERSMVILEPYCETTNDQEHLLTSIAAPIIIDGVFCGVMGYDISLDTISELVSTIKPYGDGYARLISYDGIYVGHEDPQMLMSTIEDTSIIGAIQAAKTELREEKDDNGQRIYTLFTPIEIEGTDTPWALQVSMPLEKALAPVGELSTLTILVFAGVFLVLCVVFIFVAGSISRPVSALAGVAGQLAKGQLDFAVNVKSKDEIGMLALAFEKMRSTIQHLTKDMDMLSSAIQDARLDVSANAENYEGDYSMLIGQMNTMIGSIASLVLSLGASVDEVVLNSRQIASGSQSLAQGATEQAAAIEEISASVADINVQTKENAQRATLASELAAKIRDEAQASDAKMSNLVEAVVNIDAASQNVASIIKVIDEIAFQTDILALNAAVEAARAGQHGKGFAVVAGEVKNLATRSSVSAHETTDLIEQSIARAKEGVEMARATQEALRGIVQSVDEAAAMIAEIASSSSDQYMAITQVNSSMDQVSQVVQQNTATAEESAAVSAEMDHQTSRMRELLSRYKLAEGAAAQPPAMEEPPALQPGQEETPRGFGKY